jgi:tRNA modification GTPase
MATVAQDLGLPVPAARQVAQVLWRPAAATAVAVPMVVLSYPAAFSPSGEDLLELLVPGNEWLVGAVLQACQAAGAQPAPPGGFTRQALASGRMTLDQAEAVLQVAQAADARAAAAAVGRLRGALAEQLQPLRQELLRLRMLVEAGLDFMEEDDVQAYDPAALRQTLREVATITAGMQRAATSLGRAPVVALVGPANAGKSSLFQALTGAPALISPVAGTTRDWLRAPLPDGPQGAELVDTAGWLQGASLASLRDQRAAQVDAEAVERGRDQLQGAQLIVVCAAPDVAMPAGWREALPAEVPAFVVATKCDLEDTAQHQSLTEEAVLAVSAVTGAGMPALQQYLLRHLGGGGDERQQELLRRAEAAAQQLAALAMYTDDLLAEDLRLLTDLLGDLLGATTPDDVLDAIFAGFCIGK